MKRDIYACGAVVVRHADVGCLPTHATSISPKIIGCLDPGAVSGAWWIGLLLYIFAPMTMAADWLVDRWLRDHRPGQRPWEPPKWLHSA
jgi:hypothetical protein